MRARCAVVLVALFLGPSPQAWSIREDRSERVAQRIRELESRDAEVRLEAQRELATLLTLEDLGVLAAATEAAGAEGRGRILEAVVTHAAGLALAVGLAAEERFDVRELGSAAIADLYGRWAGPDRRYSPGGVLEFLAEASPPQRALLARLSDDSLAEGLDLLARVGGLPLRLVIDPSLDPALDPFARTEKSAGRALLRGDGLELLQRLLARARLTFEGYALGDPDGVPRRLSSRAWVRIHRVGEETPPRGSELVERWLLEVARERRGEQQVLRAEAASRALGGLGWPAALDWLAARRRRGDEVALEGLVVAAERGRVVSALGEARAQAELLARLRQAVETDAQASGGDPVASLEAGRMARALGAIGPLGVGGRETAGLTLGAFESASEEERRYLCAALEGQVRSDRPALDVLRRWVAKAGVAPAARFAGCLVISGARARHDGVAELDALFHWAQAEGRPDEFLDLAVQLGWDPPAAWREPAQLPAEWPFFHRFALHTWFLARGDEERAAAHLAALIGTERSGGRFASNLTEGLRTLRLREGVSVARRVLARAVASAGVSAAQRERLEVLSGCAEASVLQRRDRALSAGTGPLEASEWLEAAALAGLDGWSQWRSRWLEGVLGADAANLGLGVRALNVAERALGERRLDGERERLVDEVRDRTAGQARWRGLGLDGDSWPRRRLSGSLDELEHLDRPVR